MLRLFKIKSSLLAIALSGTLFSSNSLADIVISGTRIIYNEAKKDVSVNLDNRGSRALLVQNWIDTGNDEADPGGIKAPFIAMPPVARIEPKNGQSVKIMYNGTTSLPKDRESVFWFNVLEVPPKAKQNEQDNQSLLQLAFRTRIKIFYRPASLQGTPVETPKKLKWRFATKGERSGLALHAENPTPYYVSFSTVTLEVSGKRYEVNEKMVPPFGQEYMDVKGAANVGPSGKVNYQAINDYGGLIDGTVQL